VLLRPKTVQLTAQLTIKRVLLRPRAAVCEDGVPASRLPPVGCAQRCTACRQYQRPHLRVRALGSECAALLPASVEGMQDLTMDARGPDRRHSRSR
jgi:hypothetical protein